VTYKRTSRFMKRRSYPKLDLTGVRDGPRQQHDDHITLLRSLPLYDYHVRHWELDRELQRQMELQLKRQQRGEAYNLGTHIPTPEGERRGDPAQREEAEGKEEYERWQLMEGWST
jgi:hypothetical protein